MTHSRNEYRNCFDVFVHCQECKQGQIVSRTRSFDVLNEGVELMTTTPAVVQRSKMKNKGPHLTKFLYQTVDGLPVLLIYCSCFHGIMPSLPYGCSIRGFLLFTHCFTPY